MKLSELLSPYIVCEYYLPLWLNIIANRGFWVLDMTIVRSLGLDEIYYQFELDDVNICCRAYKLYGRLSGPRHINYQGLSGSKQGSSYSASQTVEAIKTNMPTFIHRHKRVAQ